MRPRTFSCREPGTRDAVRPSPVYSRPSPHSSCAPLPHSVVVLILDNSLQVRSSRALFCRRPRYQHLPPTADAERPRSGNPVLAPTRLLPLYHIPRACVAKGPISRSRGARRDRRTRAALLHLQRRSLALALAHLQHPARGRPPCGAHAPLPHRSRGWRHQAHIRAYLVRAPPSAALNNLIANSGYSSAILIRTAAVAYGHLPDFPVQARDEPELSERVAWSLRHPAKRLEEAMHEEHFEAERAAHMWDKWEGGRWKPRMFRQRAGSRL